MAKRTLKLKKPVKTEPTGYFALRKEITPQNSNYHTKVASIFNSLTLKQNLT